MHRLVGSVLFVFLTLMVVGLATAALWAAPADTVIGDGTPASCEGHAIDAAMAAGGRITFNCGPDPLTIVAEAYVVASNTEVEIDGEGLITLDGENLRQIFLVSEQARLTLLNLTLTRGNVTGKGGAVANYFGELTLSNVTLQDNQTQGDDARGGAIYNQDGLLTIESSRFLGNRTIGVGGGVASVGGEMTIVDSLFEENIGNDGGGAVWVSGSTANVSYSRFHENSTETGRGVRWGGAVYNAGDMRIDHSTFAFNSAMAGGAIFGGGPGSRLRLEESTVSENSAAMAGGLLIGEGETTLSNLTVSGNHAVEAGGGIGTGVPNSAIALQNVTVFGNSAPVGANLFWAEVLVDEGQVALPMTMRNTVIAEPLGGGANCALLSPLITLGHNLADDDSCLLGENGDIAAVAALLGPLADNGGPTLTHLPLANSPLINGGDNNGCPIIDQIGQVRPMGANCDIGALEVQAEAPTPTHTATSTSTPTSTSTATSTPTPTATTTPVLPTATPTPFMPPLPIVPGLAVGPCSLIQSDFMAGGHGNFEAVVLEGNRLYHYFHVNDDRTKPWSRGQLITDKATGPGCIIQSDFMAGGHGNFEVVVPEGSKLVHYYHVNDNLTAPWQRARVITDKATGPGCIIQSDFMAGGHGNFEVVVLEGSKLVHYYHVNDNLTAEWQRGQAITDKATGSGCILQSDFMAGGHGNFEVVVQEGSKLVHYFHINDNVQGTWRVAGTISDRATGPGSLIQGDFTGGGHRNLEIVVPEGNRLVHYFHDAGRPERGWQEAQTLPTTLAGQGVVLIDSDFTSGGRRNFEVLAVVDDRTNCHTAAPCVRHFYHNNDQVTSGWLGAKVVAYTGRSQKICQVTGEIDRQWNIPTLNQTEDRAGLYGTDLGASTVFQGKLHYFFGDTWRPDGHGGYVIPNIPPRAFPDAFATSTDWYPEDCLRLDFATENVFGLETFQFRPLTVPGVDMAEYEVPIGAFSAPDMFDSAQLYVIVATDFDIASEHYGRSVLVKSNDGRNFTQVGDLSLLHLINVAPVVVNNADFPGLPTATEQGVLLFGAGAHYRHSPVILAYLPLPVSDGDPRSSLKFYTGVDDRGNPMWSEREWDATPIVNASCVGELSVIRKPPPYQWLMMYNCLSPRRGIIYHMAKNPWGPWSEEGVAFNPLIPDSDFRQPDGDGGYCHIMHDDEESCDPVADPGRSGEIGGEYGPFLIDKFTQRSQYATTVYYLMSTWNPYNVVLMRTTFDDRVPMRRLPIFDLQLAPGWRSVARDALAQATTAMSHGNGGALSVVAQGPDALLSLVPDAPISAGPYESLGFWVRGGEQSTRLRVSALGAGLTASVADEPYEIEAVGGAWTYVNAPLSALGDPASIAQLDWQVVGGDVGAEFYLDEIELVGREGEIPTIYLPLIQK